MVYNYGQPYANSAGSFPQPVVPPDSDPDEGSQVTVCFSAAWLPFVVGALQQLTLQSTWQGDDAAVLQAQNRAQLLIAFFGENMSACSNSLCIPDVLYDAMCDCIKQSFDGGGTYVENDALDPRTSTAFQAPVLTGSDVQCRAVANMVRYISDFIDDTTTALGEATEAGSILTLLVGLFVELGPFAILIDLIATLALSLFSAGATAIAAAFTSTVYDTLLCIIYCRLTSAGVVTPDALSDINDDIDAQIGGLAATILHGMFLVMGNVGLTNAGTQGSAPHDCSACTTCGWRLRFNVGNSFGNWVLRSSGEGVFSGSGWDAAVVSAPTAHKICALCLEIPTGTQLTNFQVTYNYTVGSWSGTSDTRRMAIFEYALPDLAGTILAQTVHSAPESSGSGKTIANTSSTTPRSLQINVWTAGGNPGHSDGACTITEVILEGVGAMPSIGGTPF